MQHQVIVVLDYGSQYSQLICRRVREVNVYAELVSWDRAAEALPRLKPQGIILSGGPNSVYDLGAPTLPTIVLESGVPVLGVCYGLQLLAHTLGGRVAPAQEREYGAATIHVTGAESLLFADLPDTLQVWMSHGDRVEHLPDGFLSIANSSNSPLAAIADEKRRLYGLQFHPEVVHTQHGRDILANFVKRICGCRGDWTAGNFIEESVERIREQVGPKGHVICGLSGGVDSAVAATLVHRAIGDRLACVFVDHGLLRKGEAEQVIETFERHQGMRLIAVDAKEEFLSDLADVEDPERKRKLIGARFVRVFESEAARLASEWGVETPAFLA
ncbi:MAG: glutamine-hydrolyzing GMP synthase, partial [Caldilinea sp.]